MSDDTGPETAPAARVVREERAAADDLPLHVHPEWARRFPWLIQGTTGRGGGKAAFDLGLSGSAPVGEVMGRWQRLREGVGCDRAVYAWQVHEARVAAHESAPDGFLLLDGYDGHATSADGVLLAVSVADCVPIWLVDPVRRAGAVLHGGWRGVAAGILEAGIETLNDLAGSEPDALCMHLGPAICGACYEVGPEVHTALGLERPDRNTPVDLRAVLSDRARALGIPREEITVSAFCTRCGGTGGARPFFSHRRGCAERQVGILALRPAPDRP